MKCPTCNQEAMAFSRFFIKFNPLEIRCKNCRKILKASKLMSALFFIGITIGAVFGFLFGYLLGNIIETKSYIMKLSIVMGIALAILIPLAIIIAYIAWKYGSYEKA